MTAIERIRVGDVLALQRRPVTVDPGTEYTEIGVRSFGRGIFHKEPLSGAALGAKRVFWIEPGDLVLSNVFAWEGAVAIASDEERGMIGSHRFMTFVPIDRIVPPWAAWFFRSERGMQLIKKASPGSAGRNRTLSIERFEALDIPLPPCPEQLRVADKLDRIRRYEAALVQHSAKVHEHLTALSVSTASRPDLSHVAKRRRGWRNVALGSVMQPSMDVVRVSGDGSYRNLGIRSFGRGLFGKPDIEGGATSATSLTRVHAGQFIYSRLFAFEGAYAFVAPEFDGYFVSNEFPTFDTDPEQLDARWLATLLRSPDRWAELATSSKGLGVRRQRVPVASVLAYELWLPPIEQQREMVDTVMRLHTAETTRDRADLLTKALLPAALNEAFAGLM